MYKIIEPFVLCFIPMLVAVDAIGNIPIFLGLVAGRSKKDKRRIILESVITATAMAVFFMFVGKLVLSSLGITIPDFQIAGGLLLFLISVRLLLPGNSKSALTSSSEQDVGVFPMGTPLITGPAVLTTTLILLDSYGPVLTFISLIANMGLVWVTMARAESISNLLGSSGIRAFAKIMYILLAAIGVMMIRRGVVSFSLLLK